MCGIIGYTGGDNAQGIIIDGLHALEYRGYDSAGMAVFTKDGIATLKTQGRVQELEVKAKKTLTAPAHCGIGHTRWATHGKPSEENAHPQGTDSLMLVHNGIIENYKELRRELESKGCTFRSQTDTEAAALLIDLRYKECGSILRAIRQAAKELKGSYAFGMIFKAAPGRVYALAKDSPLLIGIGEGGTFIASDVSAFIKHTEKFIRPLDGEIAEITPLGVTIYDKDGNKAESRVEISSRDKRDTEKGGFPHFMLKEIFDEPKALRKTYESLTRDGLPHFTAAEDEFLSEVDSLRIIACGTAMHAGLIGKAYIERAARLPVSVEISSEFRYSDPILSPGELAVIISQSGETADSLAALRLVKGEGIKTLSIVNTPGSSIARESHRVICTKAGTEIAVASTKAFSVQALTLMLLGARLALLRGKMSPAECRQLCREAKNNFTAVLPRLLRETEAIGQAAKAISPHSHGFFIGRGVDSYLAMEGSLKLKEISYIHSEAYAAGELKHGTISLIKEGTPVIAIATREQSREKIRSNIEECKSRGAYIIAIGSEDSAIIRETADIYIPLPRESERTAPLTAAAALQLLAYYTALNLGRDIDKPRNLAKSVTVE